MGKQKKEIHTEPRGRYFRMGLSEEEESKRGGGAGVGPTGVKQMMDEGEGHPPEPAPRGGRQGSRAHLTRDRSEGKDREGDNGPPRGSRERKAKDQGDGGHTPQILLSSTPTQHTGEAKTAEGSMRGESRESEHFQ